MSDAMQSFEEILQKRLIPEYCEGNFFAGVETKFRPTPRLFSEDDASNFVRAWDAGLIRHAGGGRYVAARNVAGEKFFNAGLRSERPRTFRLAQEAVITVAVLARLHFEFGWPAELLGTQAEGYAFDLVAYLPERRNEFIACEVKKTVAEVDRLILDMHAFCPASFSKSPGVALNARETNAFRKVQALRQRQAPIFWVAGPYGASHVFKTAFSADGGITLSATSERSLIFPR